MGRVRRVSARAGAAVCGVWVPLIVTLVAGCEQYPNAEDRWEDDIVATAFDENADFEQYRTFAVNPTVVLVTTDADGDEQLDELGDEQSAVIASAVVRNMQEAGYRQVDVDADPDLGISVTAIDTEVTGTVSWWGYYGSYWGFVGWGYYYPFTVSYSYRTGSLVTEMVDLGAPRAQFPDGGVPSGLPEDLFEESPPGLPLVWSSVAYQVLDSAGEVSMRWAQESVDQAFRQSPYLERR